MGRVLPKNVYARGDGKGEKLYFQFEFEGRVYKEKTDFKRSDLETDSGRIKIKNALKQFKQRKQNETSEDRRAERKEERQRQREVVNEPFYKVAERYLNAIKHGDRKLGIAKVKSDSTRKGYASSLANFWSYLHDINIREIDEDDLTYIFELRADLENANSWSNHFTPLKGVFKYAMKARMIIQDPSAVLSSAGYEITEPDPYSLEEKNALLDYLSRTQFGNFFRLAFGTGMRTGELLAISWDDFNGSSLYIHNSMVKDKETNDTKTHKPRFTHLGEDEIAMLKNMVRPIGGGRIFKYKKEPKQYVNEPWTRTDYRPFVEARAFATSLNLKSEAQWREFVASGEKPDDIPYSAREVYRNHGWISFEDFLGYGDRELTNGKKPMEYWKAAHEATGVRRRMGPYPWRHTYISEMLSSGVPQNLVAEQVGDRPSTIQDYYYKYIPRDNDEAVIKAARRAIEVEKPTKSLPKRDF